MRGVLSSLNLASRQRGVVEFSVVAERICNLVFSGLLGSANVLMIHFCPSALVVAGGADDLLPVHQGVVLDRHAVVGAGDLDADLYVHQSAVAA